MGRRPRRGAIPADARRPGLTAAALPPGPDTIPRMDKLAPTPDSTTFRRTPIAGTVLMNCVVIALFAYLAAEAAGRGAGWMLAAALAVIAIELFITAVLLVKSQQVRTLDRMCTDIEEADKRGEPIPDKWVPKAEKLLAARQARIGG